MLVLINLQLVRAVDAISCVINWPKITHMLVHICSCILEGSLLKILLINRGLGKLLPETARVLGAETLSSYSGFKIRLYGVSIEPNNGSFKLLHVPSNVLYLESDWQATNDFENGHVYAKPLVAKLNWFAMLNVFEEIRSSACLGTI